MAAGCRQPGKTARSTNSLCSEPASDEFCFSSFFYKAFQIAFLTLETVRQPHGRSRSRDAGRGATPIRQPDPRGKQLDLTHSDRGGLENRRRRAGSRGGDAARTPPPPTFCLGDSISCHRTLESRFHCDFSFPQPPPSSRQCPAGPPALPAWS